VWSPQPDALAAKIGIRNVFYVGNMVRDAEDAAFIDRELAGGAVIGHISYSEDVRTAVRQGRAPYDVSPTLVSEIAAIWDAVARRLETVTD
jgi:CO dehydrogenase nickel-insertion accessory protein CooC1